MGCCRETVTGNLTITQKDINDGLMLELEYTGGHSLTVSGSVTGRSYAFSGPNRRAKVDPRDCPAMLRDRRFRLKAVVRTREL